MLKSRSTMLKCLAAIDECPSCLQYFLALSAFFSGVTLELRYSLNDRAQDYAENR